LNDMRSQLESKNADIQKLKSEVETWTNSHESVWTMLQQKEKRLYELENEDDYYQNKVVMWTQTNENLETNTLKLLQLLQNVETEFINKLKYKPTALNQINYTQEFDPKKFMGDQEIDSSSPSSALLKVSPTPDTMTTKNDRKEKLKEKLKSINKSINGMDMIMDDHNGRQNVNVVNLDTDEIHTTNSVNKNTDDINTNDPQKLSNDLKSNRNVKQSKKFMQL